MGRENQGVKNAKSAKSFCSSKKKFIERKWRIRNIKICTFTLARRKKTGMLQNRNLAFFPEISNPKKMNKNFTLSAKYITLVIIAAVFTIAGAKAQSVPKLKFRQPVLVSGVNGAVGATYKFANVTSGVDAFVKIERIVNGAILINIDDSTIGYYDAWQPTVGGPNAVGSSYIKWDIEFKTTAGVVYSFAKVDAAAIDVDGDNSNVSEFVGVNGHASYDVPTLIPTLLNIQSLSDTDNINGDDPNPDNLWAFGPVANRYNIDTASEDVRINYHFTNVSILKFYTGSTVRATGGAINRYHSIYFMEIKNQNWSVLPLTYLTFDAVLSKSVVNLSWTLNAELQNDHFEVERSFDQANFSTAGIILGAQSTNKNIEQYSFRDNASEILKHTVIFYRLKQVNPGGAFSYNSVKMVRINNDVTIKPIVKILPNPYMDEVNVNFESTETGNAEIRLIDISGNVVKKLKVGISTGINNLQLKDLYSSAPGVYILDIVVNGKSISSQKLIKQ